jgi:hypothetical protein
MARTPGAAGAVLNMRINYEFGRSHAALGDGREPSDLDILQRNGRMLLWQSRSAEQVEPSLN